MKIFTPLFIFICAFLFGQKTNRFYYEVKFKKDSLSENYEKDYFVLDISKNERKFYNYEFFENDSLSKASKSGDYIYSYPKLDLRLVHTKDSEFNNYFSKAPLYYVLKSKDPLKWKISNDKKNIDRFLVQKATTEFGGRTWEAWFTTEIPFPYGPYKFYGLPGLILEISDTKSSYIFSLRGNKNLITKPDTSRFLESENGTKPIEISGAKWAQVQLAYYANPLKDYDGVLLIQNEHGETVEADTRDITLREQNRLRKYNNPIELDKAVKYPE